ncbi:ABC transporter ATP-binding protein [Gardnerella greenwoodii]|uniref:Macrolide ABC transporter substrate-binding protein n=1 Tax=Gardnerella greenwoodii TaxID=2914925 RepID=A0A2N6RYL2_9BIFI|nr:ABC transporter ATP-binding protein [Gardnerella greenwoodii]MDF0753481.1 ABC transporter ATP-binding protein [Gardnerella greenwoodii]PMC43199.1 macrolide ABC transporter substrate-binding protein [Gardnerella greenwoodii]
MCEKTVLNSEKSPVSVLNLTRVTREFMRRKHRFSAVNNVSFSLNSGDFVAIVGKSGNGKSTLLNLIAGLLKPTYGSVTVLGNKISAPELSDGEVSRLRAQNIGFVTQSQTLLPNLTVYDNILLPVQIAKSSEVKSGEVKSSEDVQDYYSNRALDFCKRLHIEDLLWCYPKELSGGEMRRVMIVRALINNPKLLLLDEPTGDLDPEHTLIVVEMLREAATRGAAVLMVTHDSEAARSADCTYTMDAGSLR